MKILPAGDRALTAEFGTVIDNDINEQVHALDRWLMQRQIEGISETIPTFRSLLIFYDPAVITGAELTAVLQEFDEGKVQAASGKKRILEVPCCYGGAYGPDLADLAGMKGMTEEEIIALHTGTDYKIYMLGFLPGFVYLGGLDPRVAAKRLDSPRVQIPAGSVGIGGSQTGVYPVVSPGGWRLIGRTPVRFYDPAAKEPILCRAGEYIRFVRITETEYAEIEESVKDGTYRPVWTGGAD